MVQTLSFDSDADRYKSFGKALDVVRKRVEADLGDGDVAYIRGVHRFSRGMEAIGRVLIHLSPEPISFALGVGALFVHKQLETTEIGHVVLHGCYDRLKGAEAYHSKGWTWAAPIDEACWHVGHNIRHHGFTNVAGKDPDIHFGPVRLTEHTPHQTHHYWQVPYSLGLLFPNFALTMNLHFTGMTDVLLGNGRDNEFDFIEDRSTEEVLSATQRALRKFVPYYGREYVFFPLLAGPAFLKVLAGNVMSEWLRDLYTAATIYCGHVGEDVHAYPEGTRARSKGEWYAMQAEATHNFQVPYRLSQLCGALDLQIEHHMFPRLPPNRLREIAPEVREICEAHGVSYRTGSWPSVLLGAFRHLWALSKPTEKEAAAAASRPALTDALWGNHAGA